MPITLEIIPSDSILNIFFLTGVIVIAVEEKRFFGSWEMSLAELCPFSPIDIFFISSSNLVDSLLLLFPSSKSTICIGEALGCRSVALTGRTRLWWGEVTGVTWADKTCETWGDGTSVAWGDETGMATLSFYFSIFFSLAIVWVLVIGREPSWQVLVIGMFLSIGWSPPPKVWAGPWVVAGVTPGVAL